VNDAAVESDLLPAEAFECSGKRLLVERRPDCLCTASVEISIGQLVAPQHILDFSPLLLGVGL
jgi:hypothetical protein